MSYNYSLLLYPLLFSSQVRYGIEMGLDEAKAKEITYAATLSHLSALTISKTTMKEVNENHRKEMMLREKEVELSKLRVRFSSIFVILFLRCFSCGLCRLFSCAGSFRVYYVCCIRSIYLQGCSTPPLRLIIVYNS